MQWIPRVERVKIDYNLKNEESIIELIIYFKLIDSPNEETMVHPIYLMGANANSNTSNLTTF